MLTNEQTRVFIVDDDHVTRHLVRKILSNSGYRIFEAANGAEAIELFDDVDPHIVLMDVMMPDVDGYTACRAIREKENFLELPIIMLTGLDDVESVRASLDAGATDFISKPINWALFEQRVQYALNSRSMHEELQNQKSRLAQAQKIAKLGSWELSIDDSALSCSDELIHLLRLEPEEKLPHLDALVAFAHPLDKEAVRAHIVDAMIKGIGYQLEHRIICRDGTELYVLQHADIIKDRSDNVIKVIGTLQDITELKSTQAIIHHQNYYDLLTDLPNRRLFTDKVIKNIAQGNNNNAVVIYMLTLDNLRTLSESLGYKATETVLISFSSRLKTLKSDSIIISRFNDNTFAIMSSDFHDLRHVTKMTDAIMQLTKKSISIDTHDIFITVSIGISIYPIDNNTAEATILGAENAMLNASKQGGGRYLFYNEKSNREAQEKLDIENDMRKGIKRGEFVPFYQPKVNAQTGVITGFEALARWEHPTKGLIAPFHFIDIAEKTGLIIDLSKSIIEQACIQTKEWSDNGIGDFVLSVNLSMKQFIDHDINSEIKNILQATGLPATQLDIEITESMAAARADDIINTLKEFKEMGVTISMDDFGTGYSSLSQLQTFPIDTIKIDRSFIVEIEGASQGVMVKTIIAMSRSLGMNVIAEGVENTSQLDMLLAHGCDNIQGYYFSPPLPADKICDYIATFYSSKKLNQKNN